MTDHTLRRALANILRGPWRRLPENVRARLWYAASRIPHYTEIHRIANFAGNLEQLKAAYATGSVEARADLSNQFDSIADQLTLPNGVTKQTFANRLANLLSAVLSAVQLPHSEIRVLDLPSSTGISSLQNIAILREASYRVTSYVLGDKYHSILYDPRRRCIFDERGNLLQVAFGRLFISLYRVGIYGDRYTFLAACLAFPHTVMAWYLRKRYRFEPANVYRRLLVVHPEVERVLGQGVFRVEEVDIFQPIQGRYDLILSFNLLQRSYWPPDIIETGVQNLAASLCEGGLLIVGNEWESFRVLQKQDGSMISRVVAGDPASDVAIAGCATSRTTAT